MVNYANAKIYRIYCNITKQCYIGSTTLPLHKRLSHHKVCYKNFLNGGLYHYISSFEVLKNNDYAIILIENYECKSKEELFQRERYYIENTECVNINIPNRSSKEWDQNNKQWRKEYNKKYYVENLKDLLEKSNEYYENHKDQIKETKKIYNENNKEKLKVTREKYRKNNKEIIKERKRQYYEKNKEAIKEKSKRKYKEKISKRSI